MVVVQPKMNVSFIYQISFGMWKYCRPSIGDARITACCESMRLLVSSENANKQMMVRFFFLILITVAMAATVASDEFRFFPFRSLAPVRVAYSAYVCIRSAATTIWRTSWTISFTMRKSHILFRSVSFNVLRFLLHRPLNSFHVWIYGFSASFIPGDKVCR